MKALTLFSLSFVFLGCASTTQRTVSQTARPRTPVQLYLFNRSGKTADLRVALDDSVLYYAQVLSATIPNEISGGRLVHRTRGRYQLVLNDYTHGQQINREVPVDAEVVYIVVTTREDGSHVDVSTSRPF
jgi:hypothetical protein